MIELYIDGRKADLTTDVSVPMNYELEKLQNPTIIKNNFSKTIQLQATPTNNKIFSFFYELDKIHTDNSFCANKRVPFQLFRDNDLVESGYLQLNNVKYTNNNYVYEITLYGGLGDFFYNLSYDADGNDLSLADLNYGIGENDEDFEFQMNADNVMQAWYNTEIDGTNVLGNTITFIPSYNGIYDDFDNNKVLINTKDNTLFPTSFSADGKTYSTIGGYGYAELNNELTEWQIRDLRCYKQRPALKLKRFIEAVCKPENNGGYEVELDGANFFNRDNPYYQDTWIALPLINPDSEDFPVAEAGLIATPITSYYRLYANGMRNEPLAISFDNNSLEEMDRAGGAATLDIDCDFSLMVYNNDTTKNNLILSKYDDDDTEPGWSGIGVWLEAVVGGQIIAVSDCNLFVKGMGRSYKVRENGKRVWKYEYIVPNQTYFDGNYNNYPKTTYIPIDGSFIPLDGSNDNNELYFHSAEGRNNTFRLSLKNVPNLENIEIKLVARRWFSENLLWNYEGLLQYPPYLFSTTGEDVDIGGLYINNIIIPSTTLNINTNKKTLQDVVITKKQLLKNKITPASLLTSFTKLFGLYFVKDATCKKIKICTRNTFFENAGIIDIDDKIDYSSEYKIEPLMFNKKWYKLACPPLDTTRMKTYKADYYEAEYGQNRINTNYNFNTDTEDLYKDNQYQNVITMLDGSKYYRRFLTKSGNTEAPAFILDGCTYKLFQNNDVAEVGDKEYSKYDIIDKDQTPIQWTNLVGADIMPKICCFDLDNDKQSLNDLNVSLVFYNGRKYLEDTAGNPIYYTLSNDVPAMATFNEGTPMYLYSKSNYDINNNQICLRVNQLPQFTRYNIEFGNVVNSLDFGLPFETYINENYTEDSTLYTNFWKSFYQDQFSENTRKVIAYVKFEDIQLGNHSLSNFYYFNNCYWLLNKIVDYDIANPYKKVRCEFIKVNDVSNYTNGTKTFIVWFEVDGDRENIENWNALTSYQVNYGGTFEVEFTAINGIQTLEISMDNVPQNEIQNHYKLEDLGNGNYKLTIFNIIGDVSYWIVGY